MSLQKALTIVGLGEVLWDLLPEGKQLGGAPANFAYWSAVLGNNGIVASRVGDDELGRAAILQLKQRRLDTSHLQQSERYPTGTVRIEVDDRGEAAYAIAEGVAWDHLEWTDDWETLAAQTDAVCFGTLARRNSHSTETISRFIHAAGKALIIFDVNLRQSFYSTSVILESITQSHVIKMNRCELAVIMEIVGMNGLDIADSARLLIDKYRLQLVCVTLGELGSILVNDSEVVVHKGLPVALADTIGSGDGFTAALVYHQLKGSGLEVMSEAANRLGSQIASCKGATSLLNAETVDQIVNPR
jgi:fructokinase